MQCVSHNRLKSNRSLNTIRHWQVHFQPGIHKPPFPAIRVIHHHRRPLAGHVTEKQRLLYAVQAAALVQATLLHQRAGLTIHFHVTASAGRGVPMTGLPSPR